MLLHFNAAPILHTISRTVPNPATGQGELQIKETVAFSAGTAENEPAFSDEAKAWHDTAEDESQPTDPLTPTQCAHALFSHLGPAPGRT